MNGETAFIGAVHHPFDHSRQHYPISIVGDHCIASPAASLAASRGLSLPIHQTPASQIHHHQQHQHPSQQHLLANSGGLCQSQAHQLQHHQHQHPAASACSTGYSVGCGSTSTGPFQHQTSVTAGQANPAHTQHNQAQAQALPLPFRTAPPAGLPASYNTPGSATQAQVHGPAHAAALSRSSAFLCQQQRMAAFSAQQQQNDELARMQELSDKWEPDATGPLVSELLASSAITQEYANADPVYQIKTASLPQKFAHYRTCRGDGHCGWRAVAFCYFETLCRIADPYKLQEEVVRLRSFRNLLNEFGHDETLYEAFADETCELLEALANTPGEGGMSLIMAAFNDDGRALPIITYLKLLTSCWMQKYPNDYQPYLAEPIQQYCSTRIEPSVVEIEEVGLSALLAVLVQPAGIATEVHYLDRSDGDEATTYEYPASTAANVSHPPVIRLLYRPGHYDILYKSEDVMINKSIPTGMVQQPIQQNVFVALQHGATEVTHHRTAFGPETIEIPGLSFYNGPHTGWPQSYGQFDVAPTPVSPAVVSPRAPATPSYPSVHSMHVPDMYFQSTPMPPTSLPNMTLPTHLSIDRGTPFRPSAWEMEASFQNSMPHQGSFQTAIFRNSHYNTAHFNNPDFEPEQWRPDNEYATGERPRKKSSH